MDGVTGFLAFSNHGGCRFLLQCRQWLPVQMRALARAKIQWSDGRIIQPPKESDLVYSRFGLTPEHIGGQTWSEPVPGTLRMMRPPGITAGGVSFDMGTVRSSILGKACSGTGRSQRWCVLEWVMLTPWNLKKFFITGRRSRRSGGCWSSWWSWSCGET